MLSAPVAGRRRSRALASPVTWAVAWRFLRNRRSRLLDGTARAALLATALGVTAMVVTMALMTGYREDLQTKLLSGNAAVLAYPTGRGAEMELGAMAGEASGPLLSEEMAARVRAIPGVTAIGPVAYGQGSVSSLAPGQAPADSQAREVTLRGVEPGPGVLSGSAEQLGPQELPETADGASGEGTMVSAGTVPGVVVGVELARSLQVGEGDLLRLVALGFSAGRPKFRYASLRITGLFDTGFAEFDRSWMVLERSVVHRLVGGLQSADLVEITTERLDQAPQIAERAQEVLGEAYLVTDAHDLNRDLFDALELQQRTLFLLLGLIVAVSTFNTASTLVVLVRERMRDIGVLATLGISPRGLTRIFLLYGTLLGAVGTALGVAIGALASWVLTEYRLIRFSPEVADIYFLSSVSFQVEPLDVAAVVGFSLAITFLACLFPAVLAGRVDPAAALRYE